MVAAVHVLSPGEVPGDVTALRLRVRPGTMAAESVLHDLGVIHMLSSDSQGMGRVGEVVRRAFQCADAMKRARGARRRAGGQRARAALPGQGDRQPGARARPGRARRLAAGGPAGRRRALVAGQLRRAARARAQGGDLGLGRVGRRERDDVALGARRRAPADRRHRRSAGAPLAGLPGARGDGGRAPDGAPARGGRGLPRPDARRTWCATRAPARCASIRARTRSRSTARPCRPRRSTRSRSRGGTCLADERRGGRAGRGSRGRHRRARGRAARGDRAPAAAGGVRAGRGIPSRPSSTCPTARRARAIARAGRPTR